MRFAPGVAILTARGGPWLLDTFTVTRNEADSVWGPGLPGLVFTTTPPEWACHHEAQDGEGWNTVWMWGVGSVSLHVPGGMVVSRGEKFYSYFSYKPGLFPLPGPSPYVSGEGGETVTWRRDSRGVPSRHWISLSPPAPPGEAPDVAAAAADAGSLAVLNFGKPLPVAEDGNAAALLHGPWNGAVPEARFPEFAGPADLRFSRWEGYSRGVGDYSMSEYLPTPGSSWKETEPSPVPAGLTTWTLRRGDWVEDPSFHPAPR